MVFIWVWFSQMFVVGIEALLCVNPIFVMLSLVVCRHSSLGLCGNPSCVSTLDCVVVCQHLIHVDVSYAAPQVHEIVNVALHREYSPGIVFIFSQGRKDLYHV
jgi:hypothetical protein